MIKDVPGSAYKAPAVGTSPAGLMTLGSKQCDTSDGRLLRSPPLEGVSSPASSGPAATPAFGSPNSTDLRLLGRRGPVIPPYALLLLASRHCTRAIYYVLHNIIAQHESLADSNTYEMATLCNRAGVRFGRCMVPPPASRSGRYRGNAGGGLYIHRVADEEVQRAS